MRTWLIRSFTCRHSMRALLRYNLMSLQETPSWPTFSAQNVSNSFGFTRQKDHEEINDIKKKHWSRKNKKMCKEQGGGWATMHPLPLTWCKYLPSVSWISQPRDDWSVFGEHLSYWHPLANCVQQPDKIKSLDTFIFPPTCKQANFWIARWRN